MIDLALSIKNARLQAIADAVDAGGEGATFTFYTGSRPANVQEAATGDELVVLPVPVPFAEAIQNGVLTGKAMPKTMATGGGEVGWGRLRDAAGVAVMDLDAGAEGSGAPATLPATQLYAGMLIEGVSLVLAEP
ncbi:hypothetical protein [Halomonas sp. CKK8]|uniref:hypothetical protein n=1 Tax=Halomonas sp. CKK8 TaxID=3036127 RepID=UPI0024158819|nr:hypothetical protein [Halomonas sp. CKK8]WFM72969.1 hypothetical protein P8934_08225 [Halomonas sp. CKK8]